MLLACNHHDQDKLHDDTRHTVKQNINHQSMSTQIGGRFLVSNHLSQQKIDIAVYETNQLKDGVYYFHVYIRNRGTEHFKLDMDKVFLVDQDGHKYHVGLIDYGLLETVHPNMTVNGIIGFEGSQKLIPAYLKFF